MSWIRTRLSFGIDSLELQQELDTTRNNSADEDKVERKREIKTCRDVVSAELVGLLVLNAAVWFRGHAHSPRSDGISRFYSATCEIHLIKNIYVTVELEK